LALLATVAAGLAALLVHLLVREDAPPTLAPAAPTTTTSAPTTAPSPEPAAAMAVPGVLLVNVSTCPGVVYEEATVTATLGAQTFSAPLERVGETRATARIEVPRSLVGQRFSVTLGWRDWVSQPAFAGAGAAELDVCPGATLRGRVVTTAGAGRFGVKVELLDAEGRRVATTTSDADGAFMAIDARLAARAIAVPDVDGPESRRPLVPLAPLENRHHDIIVGPARVVVGWVLDTAGDPQPGVRVALTWEGTQKDGRPTGWVALTDSRGQFEFKHAPLDALRVMADGGPRGSAAARVRGVSRPGRSDITLTLEPFAALRVAMSAPPANAHVVIRTSDPLAHGGVAALDPSAGGTIGAARLYRALEPALRAWNDLDVESSLTSVALAMMQPGGELPLPLGDAPLPDTEALKAAALRAARRALLESPDTASHFGVVARRLRNGMDLPTALATPFDALKPGWTETFDDDAPDSPDAAPEAAPVLTPEDLVALRARWGADLPDAAFEPARFDWTSIAHGAIGEWLQVKPGFSYDVALVIPGLRGEVACGTVFVATGDQLELPCAKTADATVSGRVVDATGRPVADAVVRGGTRLETRTGTDGRFLLKESVVRTMTLDVWICKGCQPGSAAGIAGGRRGVRFVPGTTSDLGDLPLDSAAGVGPDGAIGAGGGQLSPVAGGYFVESLDRDGALELQGVEPGHRIVRVGDDDAGSVQPQQMLRLLRDGLEQAGTPLGDGLILMLRTVEGELYPVPLNPAP
jgi:hypothetical protein